MAVVMQSSDALPRAAAAPAKTVVLLSYHLTPKDHCSGADHGCGDALL